jgi:predicted ArsR family transcriptional regulator
VSRWDQQFFTSTRGQIVTLLRRAQRTVDDLAAALGLTDNAVRAHLTRLERDGMVQQRGVRRGERRPSQVYELTPEAEQLFPKAYAPALNRLLDVLEERTSSEHIEQALRETGRRLAAEYPPATGDARARLAAAADVLARLGGLAEVEDLPDGRLRLRGYSCPLGGLIGEHPQACRMAEALVAQVSGLPVHECCERPSNEPPRCCFEVETPGA